MTQPIDRPKEEKEEGEEITSLRWLVIKAIIAVGIIAFVIYLVLPFEKPSSPWPRYASPLFYSKNLWVGLVFICMAALINAMSLFYFCKWAYRVTQALWVTVAIGVFPHLVFLPVLAIRSIKLDNDSYSMDDNEIWAVGFCAFGIFVPLLGFWVLTGLWWQI